MGGDETTGYCIPQYKPCSCKDGSVYDEIVEIAPWIGPCEEQRPAAEFICVPGYEKCLFQDGPDMCLPSFEKKSDECEDNIWNELYEKLVDGMHNRWNEPTVFPCMDFVEPIEDDSTWNMDSTDKPDGDLEPTDNDSRSDY